ncbi:hypothetical protein [Leptospira haakeii]|uniref:HEAT repeat domain-containing protein n=1 Tax=Leptospira haakeii TaxID=2023198 RepID=A0ABX4PU04_9LEPT|nr:hypothetical protein [Leptospira haakeii]PKA17569.1 hypothetical protein CH363_02675 [Leptospira haakeii]PKA21294.1 hypothetical protein CH377_02675 [Leptospira haakeii]
MYIKKILLILLLAAFALPVTAQSIDPSVYSKVKSDLTISRHKSKAEFKTSLDRIVSDPVPYLKAITEDSSIRIYVKEKAIALLEYYPTEESESVLKSKIEDGNQHKSLRNLSVKSYSSAFYGKDPQKAEIFLGTFKNDKSIGKTVDSTLQEARYSAFKKKTLPSKEDFEKYRRNKTLEKK